MSEKHRGEKKDMWTKRDPFCVKGSNDFSKNQEEEDEESTIRGI